MSISVKQRLALVGAGLLVAVLAAACPGELENAECFSPDSCCDVPGTLIAQQCALASCHDATSPQINLTPDEGLNARLLNVAGVCAGNLIDQANPDASLMYTKCLDSNTCVSKMPFGRPALTAAQLKCLRQWVGEVAGEQPTSAGSGTAATGTTTM